jgi:hypothetical protein
MKGLALRRKQADELFKPAADITIRHKIHPPSFRGGRMAIHCKLSLFVILHSRQNLAAAEVGITRTPVYISASSRQA